MSEATISVTPLRRALITGSVMLATIIQTLDQTIANVALPNIQGSMSATQDQIAWVLTSYIVASAVATPLTGFLASRFGRKTLFLLSVGGFTAVSILCGMATNLTELVIFRLLQGAFGAALVPLSQSLLLDTYPLEKHGSAMALWGMGVMVGPILGPTLGGYLTEMYNWRWVFYINLPIGALAFLGIMATVPETRKQADLRFDMFGFALLTIGVGALQLMLDRGNSEDWLSSTEIVVEGMIAGLALYMFLVHMFTARNPFLRPALFRNRNLVIGLIFTFLMGIIQLAAMVLLPPFMQHLMGYSVLTVGYVIAPRGIGMMVSMMLVGRLVGKIDARLLILFGLGLTVFSMWQISQFTLQVDMYTILQTGVLQGFGLGFVFVPLNTLTFSRILPEHRTEGTAIFSLIRNLGSSIGISIMVTLLARYTQANHAILAATVTPFRTVLQSPWLPDAWDIGTVAGVTALNAELTRQAAAMAYSTDFMIMMVVSLALIPLLALLRPPPPPAASIKTA
ncbi:MAG: DHA2 family efflux MFS transporter permease subunit [Alphaproteobacteria bacterium]